MAFRQQQRPRSAQQISNNAPEPPAEIASTSPQLKRPLDQSEEWVLFSPTAPSATTHTHTTSTERTPRTAGLSRFSEFGSLDTAARSDQDDDAGTFLGTEEELDSLDDGLHAFHEPSEYGVPASRLLQSGETVLPTHDGLGEFHLDATVQEHMWHFERPRRRPARRRSSLLRHFNVLDDADEVNQEQDRRQRIERWRLEQSKALLEEIEKETRRRRRMSMVSAARSRTDNVQLDAKLTAASSVADVQSESSEEGTENLSFWQRITRRVIRDLIGLDEDTLSVIFGESLPEEANTHTPASPSPVAFSADKALQDAGIDPSTLSEDAGGWQTRLLERVAQELGILVHQLSEHPGAFSTYQRTQITPEVPGLTSSKPNTTSSSRPLSSQPPTTSAASAHFAPTFPAAQPPLPYSEASLWGIEEESTDSPDSDPTHTATSINAEREREYWERELDLNMIFNFLVKRFTSSRPAPANRAAISTATPNSDSARRAAIIRQNHPLVNGNSNGSEKEKRKDVRGKEVGMGVKRKALGVRSQSSCKSVSVRSGGVAGRNYWDFGGSERGVGEV